MTRNTAKTLTFSVAGLYLLQLMLPFLMGTAIFFTRLQQQRHVTHNRHNSPRFQRLRINRSDKSLVFIGDDEFQYKGLLYDIHSMRVDANDYVILALADHGETSIYMHLSKLCNDNAPDHLSPLPFYFLFFEYPDTWHIHARWETKRYRNMEILPSIPVALAILKPPPRFSSLQRHHT